MEIIIEFIYNHNRNKVIFFIEMNSAFNIK